MIPKLIITDIDGVWTDGGMYYNKYDDELKKFNVSDGWGARFLRSFDIPLVIMTSENTTIVERRAIKLNIARYYLGCINKLETTIHLCKEMDIKLDEVGFIGDDLNDLPLLREVGISACPAQSPSYIKNSVDYVMTKKGGEGVFREFVELILKDKLVYENF